MQGSKFDNLSVEERKALLIRMLDEIPEDRQEEVYSMILAEFEKNNPGT